MSDSNINNNQYEVVHWINSAKGIGVVIIILGHLLYDSNIPIINRYIYSFHMPLFFILSGFLQKENKDKFEYIFRKTKRVFVPFIAFALLSFPVFGLIQFNEGVDLFSILIDSFYLRGEIYNNPLWFLFVIYEIFLIFCFFGIYKFKFNHLLLLYVLVFALGFVEYYFADHLSILNFIGFNRMIVCIGFFVMGIIIRRIKVKPPIYIVIILSFILSILFGVFLNKKISIYAFDLGNWFLFQISAISGSALIISLCKAFFDKECFFEKISKYGILLLGFQYFLIVPFTKIMNMVGLSRTIYYDLLMVVLLLILLFFIPKGYEKLKCHFKYIKIFNGEII